MSGSRTRVKIDAGDAETRVWLILVLGVVMTGFGIAYAAAAVSRGGQSPSLVNDVVAGLLSAVGGGILGATISLLVAGGADRDALRKIRSVVADSLTSSLLSEEASLEPVRRLWHHYYLTGSDARTVWRYRRFHFEQSVAVSSITVGLSVEGEMGRVRLYRVEAGIRGDRLIVIITMINGQEPPCTQIYPQFLNYKSVHYGVALLQNWDGYNMLSKAILSDRDFFDGSVPEGVVPEECFGELDDKWEAGFVRHNGLFQSPLSSDSARTEATPP